MEDRHPSQMCFKDPEFDFYPSKVLINLKSAWLLTLLQQESSFISKAPRLSRDKHAVETDIHLSLLSIEDKLLCCSKSWKARTENSIFLWDTLWDSTYKLWKHRQRHKIQFFYFCSWRVTKEAAGRNDTWSTEILTTPPGEVGLLVPVGLDCYHSWFEQLLISFCQISISHVKQWPCSRHARRRCTTSRGR